MESRFPDLNVPARERIGWVDLLRVIAFFLVVFSHSCDAFVAVFDSDRATFLQGALAGSLVRACVPLFVMMSGVLLLPVRTDAGSFFRKRIGRILVALVFWSLALPVLYFLYMLLGLYFILPILSAWLERASQRDLGIMLGIWGLTLLLPYVKMLAPMLGYAGNYGNMGLYGVCDWNEFGTFYYVSGFAGYLVLAFYLVKFPPAWSWRRTLGICIPAFLVGYLITGLGYVMMQKAFPGNYAYLEIVWYFAGINVFLMTAPLFILVQKAAARPRAWLSRLAGATFGIYLCHFIFVQAGYDLVQRIPGLPALVRIALIACGAFAVSWLVVWLMQHWRVTRRLVE